MNAFFRSHLTLFGLLATSLLWGQANLPSADAVADNNRQDEYPRSQPSGSDAWEYDTADFIVEAKSRGVGVRAFDQPLDLESGYYLITGAFKESKNLQRLIRKLEKKGLEAGSFVNPENGLHYVYAQHYVVPQLALDAAVTKLDGRYKEAMWILIVGEPGRKAPTPVVRQEDPEQTEPLEVSPEAVWSSVTPSQEASSNDPESNSDALLRKADLYFDKMWYAEAAQLYETAIKRHPEYQNARIMQRVGDAHYFNTNMERANFWYEQLYNVSQDNMSADYLFRYAHALKGNGKYARAKRFMRLYETKAKSASGRTTRDEVQRREVVLDDILSAEESFGIKNMEINSRYSEFAPMFYENNQVVFASSADSAFFHTRRYKWNDQPYLDLYVAKMNEQTDELRGAVKFSKKINTKYHEAAVAFSPDRQTMYFTRNNFGKKLKRDQNGVNHLKLYKSQKVGGQWTEAVELPFNGEDYSTGHPAISPDGKQLYFVSDMPGSIGDTDIFVVDVYEDGRFSEPRNLGPGINTAGKEMFPFVSNQKLYFSSNGHIGLGGLDVYEVALDPENGFGEVHNLGKPINSNKDDFSYIVDEETQRGFFASNRRGGKGDDDIYSFQRLLPEEANENAIAGTITDLITGETIPEALVVLLDENNRKLKELTSDADGSFVFEDLESTTKYKITFEKDSYFQENREVLTGDNELITVEVPLRKLEEMIVIEDGIKKLKTEMIHFDFDKYAIRQDAAEELDKLVEVMNEYPTMVIAIESHTDSRGKRAYNKYLSDRRARSTREYLISKGIDPRRIESAKGYGEERLLNGCDGSFRCAEKMHQLNRRSEFIIVSM